MTEKERYKTDPEYREKIKKKNRERYQNNKAYRERSREQQRIRRLDPDYRKNEDLKRKIYDKKPTSKAKQAARSGRYRKNVKENIKLNASQRDQLCTIYYNAQALNEAARGAGAENAARAVNTKYSFAVDHILPLQPEYVIFKGIKQRPYIGLHAPWNLQIIDALDNLSKLNRA